MLQKKSRPRMRERLSGELLGLTRGCDLRKEGVTVTTQADHPNNLDYRCLSLGLSHLTVIRTHILLDHLLSSVKRMIRKKRDLVNQNFLRRKFNKGSSIPRKFHGRRIAMFGRRAIAARFLNISVVGWVPDFKTSTITETNQVKAELHVLK